MKQYSIYFLLAAILVLAAAFSAAAQTEHTFALPHVSDPWDSNECLNCHLMEEDNYGLLPLPRGAEQQALCETCHNPTGSAAAMIDFANHVIHYPDNSTLTIDCSTCHDPHDYQESTDSHNGTSADNLQLVRATIDTDLVPGAFAPLVFQQKPAHYAFAAGNAPYDGACQACHTLTTFQTNDGSTNHLHMAGSGCTGCHTHESGFMGNGSAGCTGCHSGAIDNNDGIPAGGRRAVVAEFPTDAAGLHAHYGTELDEGSCLVCHSTGTHMDGYVELIDPDSGSLYRFLRPADLSTDPDLSTFCAGCHDADGAQRLADPADPFGNGNTPPDVATRFLGTLQWDEWYGDGCFPAEGTLRQTNSHHDISDSDQTWSGAKIECLDCHGAHNASADTPTADPFDTTAAWTGSMSEFCISCHSGGSGPLDPGFPPLVSGPTVAMRPFDSCEYTAAPWYVEYTWDYHPHGRDSKRGWEGYSGAAGYEMQCTVCHDPHGSYTATNTPGNPYMIRDFVDGTPFVDDGVRDNELWTGPPWDTYGTAGSVVVGISGIEVDWGSSQGLCIKCHATWTDAYSWHSFCNGCQTCHGHGQAAEGTDYGPGVDNDTNCADLTGGARTIGLRRLTFSGEKPASHQGITAADCSTCHTAH
ncbi:hypothetical protein ACFL43_03085 [Thermodesulfobacteriota bacterium]